MSYMKRDENGDLVKVYPGLEVTLTGPMMDKVRNIDPKFVRVNIWEESVSVSVSLHMILNSDDFAPKEIEKAPDAPTSEAQAKTTEPDQGFVDGSNVASTTEEVKEGDAA